MDLNSFCGSSMSGSAFRSHQGEVCCDTIYYPLHCKNKFPEELYNRPASSFERKIRVHCRNKQFLHPDYIYVLIPGAFHNYAINYKENKSF